MVLNSTRNLIIVVGNTRYDPADFVDIGNRVAALAPDIRVFVVHSTKPASDVPAAVWRDPTLTVAFSRGSKFDPIRGRFICNRQIKKLEQVAALRSAGIPVPHSEIFKPGMKLDAEFWGDLVLLKPAPVAVSSRDEKIQLYRRPKLEAMELADFPEEHAVRRMPMILQPFIDTGIKPSKYRVLTFCGEVLYAQYLELVQPRSSLAAADEELESATVATAGAERLYFHGNYPEVAELGKRVAQAFPTIPILGIDIIQDASNGQLWVLEINAGGNVWHFSSPRWAERRKRFPEILEQMHTQYNAFDTAARALIETTRRLAT